MGDRTPLVTWVLLFLAIVTLIYAIYIAGETRIILNDIEQSVAERQSSLLRSH